MFRRSHLQFLLAPVCFAALIVTALGSPMSAQSTMIYQPLVPTAIAPGSSSFILTVRGEGFASGAKVRWNGKNRATTLVSSSQLNATILAADVAHPGTATITVQNPAGQISNSVFFSVTNPISPVTTTRIDYPVTTTFFFTSRDVVVDVNGDGIQDLVVLNDERGGIGTISVLLGTVAGAFKAPSVYSVGTSPNDLAVADINGDHHPDLLAVNTDDNTMSVLLGNGDGTFQPQVTYPAGTTPAGIAVGDFNGDGKLDAVVTNDQSGVSILLGNGDGTFQAPIFTAEKGAFSPAAVADFNGDSKLDIVIANFEFNGNMLFVMFGNGDGTFQTPVSYTLPYFGPTWVQAADLDGDGHLDLAIAGVFLATMKGNGDGTFQAAVDTGSESLMEGLTFGDLNGDGKLDVIAEALNNPIYYLGNGDGTFQNFVSLPLVISGITATVGDFNHDGALDIVSGGASIFYNGNVTFAPQAKLSSLTINFGNVVVGQSSSKNFTITNSGNAPLDITDLGFKGSGMNAFSTSFDCLTDLYPGQSCTFPVTFTPSSVGTFQAHMGITDNAPNSPQAVGVMGNGTN
jgi:hypothetical protein